MKYKINCLNCDNTYIGQTEQYLKIIHSETSILTNENNDHKTRIQEIIQIKMCVWKCVFSI